jgi:FlaA1/EpsC-like NDP-sugar epimerase
MSQDFENLELIGRVGPLFREDVQNNENVLSEIVAESSFLVIGGAGTIGQSVVKELFSRSPKQLDVVDISENNLVELVRDIRSSYGYIQGEFRTFALDIGSKIFDQFLEANQYDYIFNLSALKHVRSEKDPYTMLRMIEVNILNTIQNIEKASRQGVKKYFCVSTDKAANPTNFMGATKLVMEQMLWQLSCDIDISTARFANVAFSDGSLLHGFNQRIRKRQPISAPVDTRRYFITEKESGELCMMSGLLGDSRELFFPKLDADSNSISFSEIAERYLKSKGYEPVLCGSEDEARRNAEKYIRMNKWPCYFFASDTTGEKDLEEFYTDSEEVELDRFTSIGVIKKTIENAPEGLTDFLKMMDLKLAAPAITRQEILTIFNDALPTFSHLEKGKFLDDKM